MANRFFQIARNAVQQAVGKFQNSEHGMNNFTNSQSSHTELSGHDMEVAQNALSSAMANSSDAERAQLAELQQELDSNSNQAHSSSSFQEENLSSSTAQELLDDNQHQ
jgi:hypothetical protein